MTLHRKIVGWFAAFACLVVAVLAVAEYVQSTQAVRYAVEQRAASLALQVSGNVERRWEEAASELRMLGLAAVTGTTAAVPAPDGPYTDVRVLTGDVVLHATDAWGAGAPATAGCTSGDVYFDVPFQDAAGTGYRVTARMAPAHFLAGVGASVSARLGRNGVTSLIRIADGSILYDPACALGAAAGDREGAALVAELAGRVAEHAALARGAVAQAVLGQGRGDHRAVSLTRIDGPAWMAAVTLDHAEFAAPFVALRWKYIGVMAAVLSGAFALVLTGIRRDMRRLAGISHAADAIGRGRFDVWLPPPTGDEIGRVSLALGRMTNRLGSTLRQIEVSRSMAAVGELATYLSHEIRNPLSSIRLNLQMLKRDLAGGRAPDDGEELVVMCLTELQRLEDVVRTVLDVGRSGRGALGECDAHDIIRETLGIMRNKFRDQGVEVVLRLHAEDARVGMASAALRGAVMNLALNSVDALAGQPGAKVTVTTALVDGNGSGDDAWFEIRVADNGPGIPEHIRDRIFDPFFTTKPSGNGVGLPTVLRAAQECGGMLRCETRDPGTGAEFVLELPPAWRPVAAADDGAADDDAADDDVSDNHRMAGAARG